MATLPTYLITANILTSALGEELQLINTYTEMIKLTDEPEVRKTLEVLVNDSKGHATKISDLILDVSSATSSELEEIDREVAKKVSKDSEFRLSKEAAIWYREKLSGLMKMDAKSPDLKRMTKQAAILALRIHIDSEVTAYSLYGAVLPRVGEGAKPIIKSIMEDELRHAEMLNTLVWYLKTGERETKKSAGKSGPVIISYCESCRKLYRGDVKRCEECGEQNLKHLG